ncbi:MAG: hypothetical protein ABH950_03705 [Candidatus Altiarchaeota archaeon]
MDKYLLMWVMNKKLKGREYLYLYKTKWVKGKPKSKFVRYIGPKKSVTKTFIDKCKKEEEGKEKQ